MFKNFSFKQLAHYLNRTKMTFLLGLLLTGLLLALDLYLPTIVAGLLDDGLKEGLGAIDPSDFRFKIILYLCLFLVVAGLRYASYYLFSVTSQRVILFMREDAFNHLQNLPLTYFDNLPAGKIVSRISNDTRDVEMLFKVVISSMLTGVLYFIAVFTSLFILNPLLGLIGLLPFPLVFLISADYRKKSNRFNKEYREGLSNLNASLNENISGMGIIQSFAKEKEVFSDFQDVNGSIKKAQNKLVKLDAYSSGNAINTVKLMTLGFALLYFGYSHLTGNTTVTIGLFYIFYNYMMKVFDRTQEIINRIGQLEQSRVAAEHVFTLLQEQATEVKDDTPLNLEGEIEFKDVSFSYKEGSPVLKDISLSIPKKSTAAFVGHTGSGKSTLMNLLLRFYEINEGSLLVDGVDVKELPLAGYRENIAIVLQDPILFKGTLLTNITLNNPSITREKALEALRDVGGDYLLDKLPEGLDTPVKEKGQSFSAGERQLISFARALAKDPKILVLDEATASIDSETEKVIQEGIKRLQEGRTTLLIAHRLSTIKHADQIVVLEKGHLKEKGTHEELLALHGIYHQMYEDQT